MYCPFYLIIGNYRIGDSVSYSDSISVNTEEGIDINDKDIIKDLLLKHIMKVDTYVLERGEATGSRSDIVIDSLLVISNNMSGAPSIIEHWA